MLPTSDIKRATNNTDTSNWIKEIFNDKMAPLGDLSEKTAIAIFNTLLSMAERSLTRRASTTKTVGILPILEIAIDESFKILKLFFAEIPKEERLINANSNKSYLPTFFKPPIKKIYYKNRQPAFI